MLDERGSIFPTNTSRPLVRLYGKVATGLGQEVRMGRNSSAGFFRLLLSIYSPPDLRKPISTKMQEHCGAEDCHEYEQGS
jgi:hypothetical protein